MRTVRRQLRHQRWDAFEHALVDAIAIGAEGEAALVEVLPSLPRDRQVMVAVALGDAKGAAGPAALRSAMHRTDGSRDLRCAALLALAKRCGEAASADLAEMLAHRDGAVKDYALLGLAGAGDDRAWDAVVKRLHQLVRRPSRSEVPSSRLVAVCYLARHAYGAGTQRTIRLVDEVRSAWDQLDPELERPWFDEYWPSARPDGPPAHHVVPPDPQVLLDWVRHPLFDPAYEPLSGRDVGDRPSSS